MHTDRHAALTHRMDLEWTMANLEWTMASSPTPACEDKENCWENSALRGYGLDNPHDPELRAESFRYIKNKVNRDSSSSSTSSLSSSSSTSSPSSSSKMTISAKKPNPEDRKRWNKNYRCKKEKKNAQLQAQVAWLRNELARLSKTAVRFSDEVAVLRAMVPGAPKKINAHVPATNEHTSVPRMTDLGNIFVDDDAIQEMADCFDLKEATESLGAARTVDAFFI